MSNAPVSNGPAAQPPTARLAAVLACVAAGVTLAFVWAMGPLPAGMGLSRTLAVAAASGLTVVLISGGALTLSRLAMPPHDGLRDTIAGLLGMPGAGMEDQAILQALDVRLEAADSASPASLGFGAAAAPMIVLDASDRVSAANAAFVALTRDNAEGFAGLEAEGDDDALVGREIGDLVPALSGSLSGTDSAAFVSDGRRFEIAVHATSGDGARVLCWTDVTDTSIRDAVFKVLEQNRAWAEFSVDGRLISANKTFRDISGLGDKSAAASADLIRTENGAAGAALIGQVQRGGAPHLGRFEIGGRALVEGMLCPVGDGADGFRAVLLAHDITETSRSVKAAEERQQRQNGEQRQIVETLSEALAKLAEGDLTVSIDTALGEDNEQLRTDFNTAIGRLSEAMRAVLDNAESIRGEAADISSAADDLSRRTEHQAATLEETATSIAEITASVGSTADGARQANEVVTEARKKAEESGVVVQEAVAAMGEIATSSDQISKIISVIDDIAFQTNLLALNAGVEAARAGDAGRGFAVVASEVRALAQRSSDAAREINDLISASGQHVKRGVTLVDDAGEALDRIVTSVSDIAEHVAAIAASAQDQSSGLEQISTAMSQLDQVTQQNVAMFEETTAASHALTGEAETLTATMARFHTAQGSVKKDNIIQGAFQSRRDGADAPPAETESDPAPEPHPPRAAASAGGSPAPAMAPEEDDWEDF